MFSAASSALIIVGLAGCGGGGDSGAAAPQSAPPSSVAPVPTPAQTALPTTQKPETGSVGEFAFTGTTLTGQQFDASTLAGKPAVLWFWAPWCPICASEAPDVLDVQKKHAGKLNILGVAGLDDLDKMQPFVDRTKTASVTHLGDPKGEIWRRFKITQQSTYVMIDASGKVTFSGVLSGDDLHKKVSELVA